MRYLIPLVAFGFFAGTAQAAPVTAQLNSAVAAQYTQAIPPSMSGSILVPPVSSFPVRMQNLRCQDLAVYAQQYDTTKAPPALTNTTLSTAPLTGTIASGKCTYSLHVPATKAFLFSVGAGRNIGCGGEEHLIVDGDQVGILSLPLTTRISMDDHVRSLSCKF